MATLEERFEAKVDRSGEHYLWLGSTTADGIGKLKVNGKMSSAQRVAWELEHGTIPAGAVVRTCPAERACVRVSHLTLDRRRKKPRARTRRGSGSVTKVGAGAWKLTVRAGSYEDGRPRREHEIVHVDNEEEATKELARFVAEVHNTVLPRTQAERDVTVDENEQQRRPMPSLCASMRPAPSLFLGSRNYST